jgi:hypothetical protein
LCKFNYELFVVFYDDCFVGFLLPFCIQAAEKCKCIKLQKDNEDMKEAYEVETEKKYQELKDVHASLDEVAGEKLGKEM